MANKIVVSAISLILVVGVVLGVIAVVNFTNHKKPDSVSVSNKAVTVICSKTDDSNFCQETMKGVKNPDDPMECIRAALQVGVNHFLEAVNVSGRLSVEKKDVGRLGVNFEDCKELLQFAVEDFQTVLATAQDNNVNSLSNKTGDLSNWLSAVVSYQQTCLDNFMENQDPAKDLKLDTAGRLTNLALQITDSVSDILSAFDVKFNTKPTSRRLFSLDNDGYPTWLPAADRKLLSIPVNHVPARKTGQPFHPVPSGSEMKPHVVVAQDGSGQFNTIADALRAYPKKHQGRFIIYVKAGVYNEYITIGKKLKNIFMYGDGPTKTIVTGSKSYASGYNTWKTASFSVVGEGFMCKNMGFENTAGPNGHQAVAMRVQSNKAVFLNCRFDGYQDTLYVHAYHNFFRDCVITGTIDFIFGDATTIIQNSLIIVRRPNENQRNAITAHGRVYAHEKTALVIQNCTVIAEERLMPDRFKLQTFLGRPWKNGSRTIFMESNLPDFIQPEGWSPWAGNAHLDTIYYAEFANRGPGADLSRRVNWKGYHVINKAEAQKFTLAPLLFAPEDWIKDTGVPYHVGFTSTV